MTLNYIEILIKLALGLFSLVFVINVTGKGNLAPNSAIDQIQNYVCLLYTSPSPRDTERSRMPSSA